jgi:hypothetical protein
MYPQQDLLPQEVQPGRSRKPLVLALIVVLVLIGGGVGAWLLLRDNGESNRAQYCAALKKLIPDNDLIGAVTSADASTLDEVKQLSDLAPRAVSKDWTTLNQAMASFQGSSSPDPTLLLPAIGAIQDIVRDANDQCGMDVQLPSLP